MDKKLVLLFTLTIPILLLSKDVVLKSNTGTFIINSNNGAIKNIIDNKHRLVIKNTQNRYLFMSKSKDVTAYENLDKCVKVTKSGNQVTFNCTNKKLPNITISKSYWVENNSLKRKLTFTNNSTIKYYVLPMVDVEFQKTFKEKLWHLGAGYIGPYKPFPKVETERPVNEYRQSSKGLVFINNNKNLANFSHYRVKINDTVVLPWWHSTIGHYREYADRLYYTPNGYRMGLGTLDILPKGGKISVTDCFNVFNGNVFTFFDNIFSKDKDIAKELKSIPKSPKWIKDIYCVAPMSMTDYTRYLAQMTNDGIIMPLGTPLADWADYRSKNGYTGLNGGEITAKEFVDFMNKYKAASPRLKPVSYGIVISTFFNTDILKEHPEWFRKFDRSGNEDSLFPGLANNYQSMFNNVGLRNFFVESLMQYVNNYKGSTIYLDEAQMTNTIDWQRNQITRDDHSVLFWKELKKKAITQDIALFYNGSGLPYADINYMESPHEMKPELWRNYVGVAWGLGLINRCAPAMRMVPLYWSRVTDYVNRILALGWIPAPGVSASIPVMRAVYQTGNTYPFNVEYKPDWKSDESLEIESHAVQRENSQDIMLSFINRSKKAVNIPVSVNLTTLGFAADDKINIWKIDYIYDSKEMLLLSDKELQENYRKYQWIDGAAITKPVLVYSGKANKTFRDTSSKLATNKMTTYLFTKGNVAIYSIDNLVQNSFYTTSRKALIKNNILDFKVDGEVLLIDKAKNFSDIKLNGKNANYRFIDINKTIGVVVKVPKGKHTLTWKTIPNVKNNNTAPKARVKVNDIVCPDNKIITVKRNNIDIYTGKTPVKLPVKRKSGIYKISYPGSNKSVDLRVFGGQGTSVKKLFYLFQKEQKKVTNVNVKHKDVTVTQEAEYIGRYEDVTGMQQNILPAVAKANAKNLTITSGSTRRDGINLYHSSYAGLELKNARQIKVLLTNSFRSTNSVRRGHIQKGGGKPDTNFAGIIIDYQVNNKYTKRVALSVGLYHPSYSRTEPSWGKANSKVDLNLELGDFINNYPKKEFSLDLEDFAPKNWNGTCYITVGTARIFPNRQLTLKILNFNDKKANDFLKPVLPTVSGKRIKPKALTSCVLKKKPLSLNKINPQEWEKWSKFDALQPFGMDPKVILRSKTNAFIAHDFEYIYLGIKALDSRMGIAKFAEVYRNERIEFLLARPDGKLFQVLVDTKGQNMVFINGQQSELDGVISSANYQAGIGTNIFVAIPIDYLRFDMQRTPVIVKANLCRVRLSVPVEYSVWSPLEKSFAEQNNYSNIVLHFNGN